MSQALTEKTARERKLLAEYSVRLKAIKGLRAMLFPEQLKFIDDPARLKAAQCSRRAGKSYCTGIYLILTALETPGITGLYIATTRDSAKKIMFKDVLKTLNRKFKLGMTFNETTLQVTFDNGSCLYLMGTDSAPDEADKALGQKYKLVVIDEAASHKQDQRYLVYSVLYPACSDNLGTICLIGSTGNRTYTLFYDIVGREIDDPEYEKGWSIHKWDWRNNPHTCEHVQSTINDLIAKNPLVVETTAFRQMYLNEWVRDAGTFVYKYASPRNDIGALPNNQDYYYTLSLDLGYDDATAITIAAYSGEDPNMYYVEAFKRREMIISEVVNVLDVFKHKYRPVKWVVDGASKQAVEELKQRYGFPLTTADKMGKSDMIEIMNSDFIMGKIKVLPGAREIIEEWKKLTWTPNSDKRIESDNCENHLADAALYNWRNCYHYAAQRPVVKAKKGSQEELDEWWQKEGNKVIRKKNTTEDFLTRDFKKDYF